MVKKIKNCRIVENCFSTIFIKNNTYTLTSDCSPTGRLLCLLIQHIPLFIFVLLKRTSLPSNRLPKHFPNDESVEVKKREHNKNKNKKNTQNDVDVL